MIKAQIKEAILEKGTFNNKLTDWGLNLWRHFIYGDFSYRDYEKAMELQKENNKKKIRSFVIFSYCNLIANEFNCSYSYAQKVIVDLFGKQSLESVNDELINEVLNLGK